MIADQAAWSTARCELPRMSLSVSYYALRVCPRSDTRAWWDAAGRAKAGAPPAIRALLSRRSRVELSQDEAREAISWAERVEGWGGPGLPPLWIYAGPAWDAET
jgi:hypothetical protein